MFFGLFHMLFPIMFFVVFILILGTIIASIFRGTKEWNRNNQSPRLAVQATVVSKRTNVSHHTNRGANDMTYMTSNTTYYVTFQVESGDRMEFKINGSEYGMLAEHDCGILSFQGTRYLGFERN